MGKIDKKVAVITGGARGIGKQIALTFSGEGADVVIGDVIDMESTAQEIKKLGRRVITVKTDVSKRKDVENLIDMAIKKFKKVDILVNNAGIVRRASLIEMTEEDWDAVFNINLKGTFLCTQVVSKHMIKEKYGKIINMSSIAGTISVFPRIGGYGASKAAVAQLTKSSALELGPYGINVNAIAPGVIVTDMAFSQRSSAEIKRFLKDRKKKAALGRVGTPQDIANLALFLASEESCFITGQVIGCNGGRL